ncbi:MAG: MarR family transcriptional regulator [Cyclobacteriaceae bacterium]
MTEGNITDVRSFNRFYTQIIGLLDKHILNSQYSLLEVRILYELYHREGTSASEIMLSLNIDKGNLSRVLRYFEKKKLLTKKRSINDGRSAYLHLTVAGKKEFEALNDASSRQIKEILKNLSTADCDRLIQYMAGIKIILSNVG